MLRDLVTRKTTGMILVNIDPWGFTYFDKSSFRGDYLLAAKSRDVRRRLAQMGEGVQRPNGRLASLALDLFSDSDFERQYFTDPTHLNCDGAVRFSRAN